MLIQENSALLKSLITQLSVVDVRSSTLLSGDIEGILLGLRDLLALKMITGEFRYGLTVDPLGHLLTSAEGILLTRRGSLFSN